MKWQITSPPAILPIVYGEAKAQARITDDAERAWVERIALPNIVATAEKEAAVSLITRAIAATIFEHHDIHHGRIKLPMGPVQSVTGILDGNGNTVSTTLYEMRRDGLTDFLYLKSDQKLPIVITYLAGYGNAATDIPPDIKGMMLAHFSFLFDNRGADVDPVALDRVYRKYRSFAQ